MNASNVTHTLSVNKGLKELIIDLQQQIVVYKNIFCTPKFLILQSKKFIPQGKILFIPIKKVYTNCVIGNQEDIDEIKLKRL